MRTSFPRVFAGCDSNEEQSNGQNQTPVGHVFAVCVDLSTCQIVKLLFFISISTIPLDVDNSWSNSSRFEWLFG